MADHPTRAILEGLLRAELPASELKEVVSHLLEGCFACQDRLVELAEAISAEPSGREDESDAAYDAAIDRAFTAALAQQTALQQERAEADRLVGHLAAQPGAPAGNPAGARRRAPAAGLGTWGICEALLEKTRSLRYDDPARMLFFAELAALAAGSLPAERYGREPVEDMRARAWAELANARRVSDDLAGAEEAMTTAVGHLHHGSGDLLLLARLMDLTASLRTAQRSFAEAFRLLDSAFLLYQACGERHLAGRTLISKGIYAGYKDDPREAVRLLATGLAMIDPSREPELVLTAAHDLTWWVADMGQVEEARQLLRQSRPLYELKPGRMNRLRLRWLEGKIAAGRSQLDEAEAAYREVREGFARQELPYQRALASLDLAMVWVQQGKTAETRTLVEEMVLAFRALRIEREVLVALLLLRDAAVHERATLELVQLVANLLKPLGQAHVPRSE